MQLQNANSENAFDLMASEELIATLATALVPALSAVVNAAVEKALAVHTSATMSKEDFASANGISKSVLEKWITNGVVLLAPTPTTTVKRRIECKKTGQKRTDVMEKHGNALINVAAWREKNLQHAINCRYIKR